MSTRPINVPHGASRIVSAPAILRAVVGPGYAIAVRLKDGRVGGLLHMRARALSKETVSVYEESEQIVSTVKAFISKLKEFDPLLSSAKAEIVGGADVLRILPYSMREEHAEERAELFESLLVDHKIDVESVEVGGTSGRTVLLELNNTESPPQPMEIKSSVDQRSRALAGRVTSLSLSPSRLNSQKLQTVEAGDLKIDSSPAQFVAVLGSCVGVALWDPRSKIGGMVHVMIPEAGGPVRNPARFADTAVYHLVDELEKAGANRARLIAKIAGGANVLFVGHNAYQFRIGKRNEEKVKLALAEMKIPIHDEDLGGHRGRKMWVNLRTFDVRIKVLPGGSRSHGKS